MDWEELSPHTQNIFKSTGLKFHKMRRLIADLKDKKNIVIHYLLVCQLLRIGIEITEIHEVAIFKQSAWMKDFVMTRKTRRDQSQDQVMKLMNKLIVNSIYG